MPAMPRVRDVDDLISDRARGIDASGIRRIWELGATLKRPINLSIGQPDFPVPDPIKTATIDAIRGDRNGYTPTGGAPDLRRAIARHLQRDVGWDCGDSAATAGPELLVTAGTSGGLLLACLALLNPGDEIVIPDPYFVAYPSLAKMAGGTAVRCEVYPDFRMTAARVERCLTERTKAVLVNSPANPTGVVLSSEELRDLVALCEERGVLLISDEIYDEFTYPEAREEGRCPSPARITPRVLLVRGFGKTYGCTGWRLGYVAGPRSIVSEMAKLQQYSFVCAPSMAQAGVAAAFDVDMSDTVERYRARRDLVVERLGAVTEVTTPGGAFYAFVKVPERLGMSGTEFAERAVSRRVLVIPGGVFSERDTHVRLSFAVADDVLEEGLEALVSMMR